MAGTQPANGALGEAERALQVRLVETLISSEAVPSPQTRPPLSSTAGRHPGGVCNLVNREEQRPPAIGEGTQCGGGVPGLTKVEPLERLVDHQDRLRSEQTERQQGALGLAFRQRAKALVEQGPEFEQLNDALAIDRIAPEKPNREVQDPLDRLVCIRANAIRDVEDSDDRARSSSRSRVPPSAAPRLVARLLRGTRTTWFFRRRWDRSNEDLASLHAERHIINGLESPEGLDRPETTSNGAEVDNTCLASMHPGRHIVVRRDSARVEVPDQRQDRIEDVRPAVGPWGTPR